MRLLIIRFLPLFSLSRILFLKNLVFHAEKLLFEKNNNTEQIFLTSAPYFSCATFRITQILGKQIQQMILLLHFLCLVCPDEPVQDIWQYPLSVFLVCILRAEELTTKIDCHFHIYLIFMNIFQLFLNYDFIHNAIAEIQHQHCRKYFLLHKIVFLSV